MHIKREGKKNCLESQVWFPENTNLLKCIIRSSYLNKILEEKFLPNLAQKANGLLNDTESGLL